MILSIDKVHNKIKLSYIARDTYVPIDGFGQTTLNHAYAYEGPEPAIQTLNENFDMNIQSFVTVNLSQLSEIINYIGGIDMNISEDEFASTNEIIASMVGSTDAAPIPSAAKAFT